MSENFSNLLKESYLKTDFQPGTVIQGTIVEIRSDFIIVNAGLKSEGIIPAIEFQNEDIHVGDVVDVIIETPDNGFGETCLSREKARRTKAWTDLEKSYKADKVVKGQIVDRVKGGFTVAIDSIRAFLPGSLADVKPVRDAGYLEGKDLEFKIIKMDKRRNNVVLSRRAVMEAETSAERQSRLDELQEGQVVTGAVKNVTEYGAFIDLGGGIDGLLHIVDISWKRVRHPEDVLKVGDSVRLSVLKIDREKNRISLGMKQLGEDPWLNVERRYVPGTRVFGTVTNVTDYGCFVQLEEGIEGLVHMSELDWTNKNIHPSKVVQPGQEIEVMVLDIDEERRRISLGIKQCKPNPWQEFADKYKKDDKISGNIHSMTDFGMFIGLEGNIDGLVHSSDVAWIDPEQAIRNYKKGDKVEAVILAIDPERERISLGIKQLEKDPLTEFLETQDPEAMISGTVKEVESKQATLQLADGVVGQLRVQNYSSTPVKDLTEHIKVGDVLDVKIISADRKNRVISVSHKVLEKKSAAATPEKKSTKPAAAHAPTKTTLGDLLREQMKSKENKEEK